jgi:RNA polymerase sigma factor (sigma-70 family)
MGDVEGEADASRAVIALYQSHALGLTRLAFIMLGDRHGAEDVVQEAFCGLYRAWDRLPDHDNVLGYLRVSVLNGCRSAIRRTRRTPRALAVPPAPSAEADALAGEEQRAAVAALRRLPPGSAKHLCSATSPIFPSMRPRWRWA